MRTFPIQSIRTIVISLLIASPAQAQPNDSGWLDLLYGIGDVINDQIFKDKPQKQQGDKRLQKPDFLPQGWQTEFLHEPVFDSDILVVEAGRENPETVLMVHGLGQEGFRIWLKTVPALEKQYHVLMLDLPGFGYSGLPSGRFSPENYARVLEWLVHKKAAGKVHLIGHSMGGAVALNFGSNFPELVRDAVLVDVAGILHRTAFIKHVAQPLIPDDFIPLSVKGKTIESVLLNDTLTRIITLAPDPPEALKKSELLWNLATVNKPNINAAFALIETDFTTDLEKFTHPTTLIWGADDPVTPVRTARLLHHHLPNAELKFIAGAGHSPMLTHPDELNRLVTDALDPENKISKPDKLRHIPSHKNLECDRQSGRTYTGRYNKISIHNCEHVHLRDISASELIIENSLVYIENTSISSSYTACRIGDSIIVATNLICSGKTGLLADNSRLDFAGTEIRGDKTAGEIRNRSYLVFSVSRIQSPGYSGTLHGDYQLNDTQLEKALAQQPPVTDTGDYKSSI